MLKREDYIFLLYGPTYIKGRAKYNYKYVKMYLDP